MIKNSLYAKYMKERQNAEILENESGFVVYKFLEKECFINEMFVDTNKRSKGVGRALIYELEAIALEKGCDCISANIHLWDKGASNTLMAALSVGFEVSRSEQNILLIAKKIKGGS